MTSPSPAGTMARYGEIGHSLDRSGLYIEYRWCALCYPSCALWCIIWGLPSCVHSGDVISNGRLRCTGADVPSFIQLELYTLCLINWSLVDSLHSSPSHSHLELSNKISPGSVAGGIIQLYCSCGRTRSHVPSLVSNCEINATLGNDNRLFN